MTELLNSETSTPNEIIFQYVKDKVGIYSYDGEPKLLHSSNEIEFTDFKNLSDNVFGDENYKITEVFHGNIVEYQLEKSGERNNFYSQLQPNGITYYNRKDLNQFKGFPHVHLVKKIKTQTINDLKSVKEDPYHLYYVPAEGQTEEMCLEAVKRNGYVLAHVKKQTDAICKAAVNQNGLALEYVEDQTEDICMAAVKQNGLALIHVKKQTEDICMAALEQNGLAIQYIDEPTEDMCMEAVGQNKGAIEFIKNPTYSVLLVLEEDEKGRIWWR